MASPWVAWWPLPQGKKDCSCLPMATLLSPSSPATSSSWSGSQHWAISMAAWPSGRPVVTWEEAKLAGVVEQCVPPKRDQPNLLAAPKAYPSFIKGPAPQSQYKNTKSPISLITIKNPKNGKLRGQGRGPWARGTGSPAHGTRPGCRVPWYCCCYEVRGQRLSCGSHRSPGLRTLTSSGVCSASACPGSCPAGQR